MSRRRSSGLFETLIKSAFGFGTTVHYKKDFWGHKQKVVKHHDSGKKKTYTHGTGFWGTTTKTKTEKNGSVIEEGKLKKRFWGGADEHAQRADGTTVERNYRPGFFKNHVTTHVNGQCFKCGGTGSKTLDCKICTGRGTVHLDARPCFVCHGSGKVRNSQCRKCSGTGHHKPAADVTCKKCSGRGNFTVTCNRCHGSGRYSKTTYK
jgi:DnaJ-class molecular chaperone